MFELRVDRDGAAKMLRTRTKMKDAMKVMVEVSGQLLNRICIGLAVIRYCLKIWSIMQGE